MKASPFACARMLSVICIVGSLLTYCTGCTSARGEWALARDGLSQTENAIVAANQSGLLPDKDLVALEPFAKASQTALAEADHELQANNDQPTSRFRYYLNLAATTLTKLKNFQTVKK
jgi:hypothetical protein